MTDNRRRVVLGISGHRTTHVVDWAIAYLDQADSVHIVQAYRPIPYAAMDWQLPIDNGTLIKRQLRAAASRLARHRPDLTVTTESTHLPAATALAAAARHADLVLVGASHSDRSRGVLADLLDEVEPPTVVLGTGEPVTTSSIAAMLRGSQGDDAVLQAAFAEAHRSRCGLLVVKPWQPPLDGSGRFAETAEQKMLDGILAGWRERYPDIGVTAELRFGQTPAELVRHVAGTDVLALGLPRAGTEYGYHQVLLHEVIPARPRLTMLVPERALTHRELVTAGRLSWPGEG
ncbi:MAG TPA: universal stress protein [Jatrophihabitans sp.]|nr:universal stress protein [Jatrophihabitans sp.]